MRSAIDDASQGPETPEPATDVAEPAGDGEHGPGRSRDLRFLVRPRWLAFHALVLTAIIVMVNLSLWQFRRLDERREFNATIEARYELPAEPLDDVLVSGEPDDVEWRSVTASGRYVPDEQLLVVNRSQGGRAGDTIVTPLALDDGRVLLVARGFVPLGVAPPDAPTGAVTVTGELRRSEVRRTGQLSDPSEGDLVEAQRIDIERLAPQLPGEAVPMWMMLESSDPPESIGIEPVARPTLSERNHLSYAVQWLIFAAAVAVGWVLAVRRSVAQRRRVSATTGAGVDRPARDVDATTTAPPGTAQP